MIPEKYNARISRLKSIAEVHAVHKELEISPGIVVDLSQFLTHKFKLVQFPENPICLVLDHLDTEK